jgi:hypothetical protein
MEKWTEKQLREEMDKVVEEAVEHGYIAKPWNKGDNYRVYISEPWTGGRKKDCGYCKINLDGSREAAFGRNRHSLCCVLNLT